MSQQEYTNVPVHTGRELATRKNDKAAQTVNTVTQLLSAQFKAIKSALPKHMTPERMCRVALNTIRRTPALLECAPETMVAAIVEASSLGLEIDMRGQAYLVPYWNKKTQRKDVQLIPGYKGLMDLAYRSGRVTCIFAEVVCENDTFKFSLGLKPVLEHTPALDERGPLRAVYAVAQMKDADAQFVVLGRGDVEKVKKASKAANSGPWSDWEEEMWKKTAIRRLCKLLPLSPEMQRAVAIDEAVEAGLPQGLGETVLDIPVVEETASEQVQPAALLAEGEAVTIERPTQQAERPAPAPAPAQEQQSAQPAPAAADSFRCPKNDKAVTEADCAKCSSRAGCPAWNEEVF